jgi:hypothetical protein
MLKYSTLTLKKGVVPVFFLKISPLRPLRQKISVAYFSGTAPFVYRL